MKRNRILKSLRLVVLASFLVLITIQAYLHQVKGGDKAASIHALCPYGGLESLYSLLSSGTFIQKIFSGTLIIFILTVFLAILFRRSFCGLICPLGALQEFSGILGKKIFGKRFLVPEKIDKPLRYLKYVVLLITTYYAWKTSGLWISPYDPWAAYGHLSEGLSSVIEGTLVGFIILIATIVGSIVYDRFFCKYLCPMGALYGIIGKISPNKIVRSNTMCTNCDICNKSCPMNIDVKNSDKITSAECISCNNCILSCPKKGTLEIKQGKKAVNPAIAMVLAISLLFGGVFISKAAGMYSTLPKALPAGKTITIDEIRGYMTLKEISYRTNIELKDLYKKLEIPENVPSETKFKEIKKFVPDLTDEKAKEILKK